MFLNACCDRQDVWVKDDVLRRQADSFRENPIRPITDFRLALERLSLALLVKGHDDHRSPISTRKRGLLDEFLLTFF